jgi:hypothetical protein
MKQLMEQVFMEVVISGENRNVKRLLSLFISFGENRSKIPMNGFFTDSIEEEEKDLIDGVSWDGFGR